MTQGITGRTAQEIAASVRGMVESGVLTPGMSLPPVRRLADELGVNRNTVVAAYRRLTLAHITVSRGRAGTSVAEPARTSEEGYAPDATLRDVSSGNPDSGFLPQIEHVMGRALREPVLYGHPAVDPGLDAWGRAWIGADHQRDFRLTVTSGAVDAVERLLAQHLTHGEAVAVEDPCFLASINTIRLAGYTPVPVPVDAEGMTVDGLETALAAGARAVICTPRAHNPTGVSLSADRAEALRAVLASHPYVLVIEDDHFSMIASTPYRTIINERHARWGLVRSVSKWLGPDLRLAMVASDHVTGDRLARRISPGTTWVSHVLQRLVHAVVTDPATVGQVDRARAHYRSRNHRFIELLDDGGITGTAGDGLNVWADVGGPGDKMQARLEDRGWLARSGGSFRLKDATTDHHVRLTVHALTDAEMRTLVQDVAGAMSLAPTGSARGVA